MPCIADIHEAADLEALPGDVAALFATEADLAGGAGSTGCSLYATRAWYRVVVASALPAGAVACFVWVTLDGVPAALFPLLRLANGEIQSLTTPYSCEYVPLLAADLTPDALLRVFGAFGQWCRSRPALRLEALAPEWPGLAVLQQGLRAAGLSVLSFRHFGKWYEPTAGVTWAQYLAGRDGALRETVRRRVARSARDPGIRFALLRRQDDVEVGIAAFETVYAKSWKQPEPYPSFNATLIRTASALGILRLAVMWRQEVAVAVQYWIVSGGRASMLKLAHDEAFKLLSPGTVLTAWVIESLLEREAITEIDFGRGDDPYKRAWTRQRRQRIGLLLANPRSFAGLVLIGRHRLGVAGRRLQMALQSVVKRCVA
jgi:hypothetical protein